MNEMMWKHKNGRTAEESSGEYLICDEHENFLKAVSKESLLSLGFIQEPDRATACAKEIMELTENWSDSITDIIKKHYPEE